MPDALRRLKSVAEEIKPEAGVVHKRLPASVTVSAGVWAALAVTALWSGVDVFDSGRPETQGLNSGDVAPSSLKASSMSVPTLLTLIAGIVVLLGVGLLLLGLTFSSYVLYLSGTVTVITLAAHNALLAVLAMLLLIIAASLLLTRPARLFLAPASVRAAYFDRRDDARRATTERVTGVDRAAARVPAAVPAAPASEVAPTAQVSARPSARPSADGTARRRPSPVPRSTP